MKLALRLMLTWLPLYSEHQDMAENEKTSEEIAKLAAKALRNPDAVTKKQVQQLAGALLTQAPDKPKKPAKPAPRKPAPKPRK